MKIFKNRIVQFALFLTLLASIGAGLLYFEQDVERPEEVVATAPVAPLEGLVDFDYDRDHAFINSVFADDENWYWLVEGTRNNFSPEYMMKTLTTSRDPRTAGQLILKVLYEGSTPIGFLAYFMKNFYQGKIRFVYVDKAYRGRGYGRKLVQSAIEDLKSRGATQIKLVTRVGNKASRKVYERLGFKEAYVTENNLIYYTKTLL